MNYENNYPTVLIHGFAGADYSNGLTKIFRYFGSFTKDLKKTMEPKGYEIYQPGLGPFNGAWPRACILWAYLVGGRVDYGKVHSERNHMARYGRTYPGVLKDWGKEGDHKKINLVGHSFGGPTVLLFASLLQEGCKEEIEGTPADELSDLFKGGLGHLLHTVTTLDGCQNGISATDMVGPTVLKVLSGIVDGLGVIYNSSKFRSVYDFKMDAYGLQDNPEDGKELRLINPLTKLKEIKNAVNSEDDIFQSIRVAYCQEEVKKYRVVPNAYYFTYRGIITHKAKHFDAQVPDLGMDPLFLILVYPMGLYQNKKLGIDASWKESDGCVNLPGQNAPEGFPYEDWAHQAPSEIKPGLCYHMPVDRHDHNNVIGMFWPKEKFFSLYEEMFERFRMLPDAD